MKEVLLEGLASHVDEATVQTWYFEEGDPINEGDDLAELSVGDGTVTLQAPCTGILAEVYYDEGEVVAKGEVLCIIDDEDEDVVDEEDEEDGKSKKSDDDE